MDPALAGGLRPSIVEELMLGVGLVTVAWLGLGILRRLLDYVLSAGTFIAGLVAVGALIYYRPSRVYDWIQATAAQRWAQAPDSEQLVDQALAGLDWMRGRLQREKR